MNTGGDDRKNRQKAGPSAPADRSAEARAERLRARLRENLRRRKEQARRRKDGAHPSAGTEHEGKGQTDG